MTHTYAVLEISPEAHDEIARKLREAGYDHAFLEDGLDMHGICLARARRRADTNPRHIPASGEDS